MIRNMSRVFNYKIEYVVDKESGEVTATIPKLKHLSSFGDSFAEAEANVKDAAFGYLDALEREGIRN